MGLLVFISNTIHDHGQPAHLRLRDPKVPQLLNLPKYGGSESRYCPARVYRYVVDDKGELKLHISAQNCLQCKIVSEQVADLASKPSSHFDTIFNQAFGRQKESSRRLASGAGGGDEIKSHAWFKSIN